MHLCSFTPADVMNQIVPYLQLKFLKLLELSYFLWLIAGFGALSAVIAVFMIRFKDWHQSSTCT
jgi:hypothetical protein